MGETFAELLERYFKRNSGPIKKGKVVKIIGKEVYVDFGWKSEGVVPLDEFETPPKVGDEVDVVVIEPETEDGVALLSHQQAKLLKSWDEAADEIEREGTVEGRIIQRVRGGYKVRLKNAIVAFLPLSQVDVIPVVHYDDWLDREIRAKVLSVDRKRKSVVISRRKLIEEERRKTRDEILSKLEEGQIVEGVVKNIVDFGVFLDIGGIDGLLHKSEISWSELKSPYDVAKVGDRIKVAVKKIDRDKKRVYFSLKAMTDDPWQRIDDILKVGDLVKGKVAYQTKNGYLIELENDVAAFVPFKDNMPSLKPGKTYNFEVEDIDKKKRKVFLRWHQEPQK